MDIRFSRHAKRRMALYEIDEHDVLLAIRQGNRQVLPDGKLSFIFEIKHKSRHPLKVVAVERPYSLTIVTAYPLKKAR